MPTDFSLYNPNRTNYNFGNGYKFRNPNNYNSLNFSNKGLSDYKGLYQEQNNINTSSENGLSGLSGMGFSAIRTIGNNIIGGAVNREVYSNLDSPYAQQVKDLFDATQDPLARAVKNLTGKSRDSILTAIHNDTPNEDLFKFNITGNDNASLLNNFGYRDISDEELGIRQNIRRKNFWQAFGDFNNQAGQGATYGAEMGGWVGALAGLALGAGAGGINWAYDNANTTTFNNAINQNNMLKRMREKSYQDDYLTQYSNQVNDVSNMNYRNNIRDYYGILRNGGPITERLKRTMTTSSHPQVVYWDSVRTPKQSYGAFGGGQSSGAGYSGRWGDVDYIENTPIPATYRTFDEAFANAVRNNINPFYYNGKPYSIEIDPNYSGTGKKELELITPALNERKIYDNVGNEIQDSTRMELYRGQPTGFIEREDYGNGKVKQTYIGASPFRDGGSIRDPYYWQNQYKNGGNTKKKKSTASNGMVSNFKEEIMPTKPVMDALISNYYSDIRPYMINSAKQNVLDAAKSNYIDDALNTVISGYWNNTNKTNQNNMTSGIMSNYLDDIRRGLYRNGGELNTMDDINNGFIDITEGGTHEQNPFGGIPVNIAEDGLPNLVEEGEMIYNGMVYSDNLRPSEETKKRLGVKGTTYANIVRNSQKYSAERPDDPVAKEYDKYITTVLAIDQEQQKTDKYMRSNKKRGIRGHYADWGARLHDIGRLAPIFGSSYLSDIFGNTNQYDYSELDDFRKNAGDIQAPVTTSYSDVGQHLRFNPFDTDYMLNRAANQAASTNSMLRYTSPTPATMLRGIQAANYANQLAMSNGLLATRQQNNDMRNAVIGANNTLDLQNAGNRLNVNLNNMQAINRYREALADRNLRMAGSLAQMRSEIDNAISNARNINKDSFLTSIADRSKESTIFDMIKGDKSLLYAWLNRGNGGMGYKGNLRCGGSIRRRK